ncbi:Gfo/Idh/MocA family protein [Kibdelosporangium phytohabitans]|uniref:Oxidoreductase n=1 Tax=Kibdelosporangium phytohabitans TaxID=860235 RepID=A0A0N9I6L5_9PSEU|nr:Gfo/Idh/MocA family oxidoreductase [Kibdelosporangium phytohabitans]ALG11835.1 oxidoreductase [Kibdelosporangium phytohabitans]MBE1463257.1 putative dehydrogenase [Kibdelosporangium phytohabitans]
MTQQQRFQAAIVGCGVVAETSHLPALRASADRVDLVAAVESDPERLADFQSQYDIASAYTSVADMLSDCRPDLVIVCTPPATHADIAVQSLEAGAWVLLEKPPCLSLAEYARIEAAETGGGPYAGVVFQHRFGSGARNAVDLISSGALGQPLVAVCTTAWYRDQTYFDVPWRGRWETEGGGTTMGHGIHQMDLLLAMLGEWEEVRAMAGRLARAVDTEDVSMASVRFAGGAMASIVNSTLSPREESYIRVDLTDATVELTHLYGYTNADWRYTPAVHVRDAERIASWTDLPQDVTSSHTAQLPYFLDAMAKGERPPLSGRQGREALELVAAIYRSAFTGQPVRRGDIGPDDPYYHRMDGVTE